MATAALFHDPLWVPLDSSGNAYPGAKMYIYRAGTSTAVVTYTTYDTLGSNHTSPVTASSAGVFPAIWVAKTDSYRYRRVIKTSAGVTIRDDDNLSFPAAIPSAYDRTAAETAAGVVPTNYAYLPGDVRRYGTNTTPGTTDMTAAIQAAIDVCETSGLPIQGVDGTVLISDTLTVTTLAGDLSMMTVRCPSSTVSPAIRVGVTSSGPTRHRGHLKLPKVENSSKPASGWASQQTGIEFAEVYEGDFYVPHVKGFAVGVRCGGYTSGFAYNTVRFGQIENCKVGLKIGGQQTTGWANQNTFIGGRFNIYSTEGSAISGARYIQLTPTADTSTGTDWPNGNTFVGAAIESGEPEYLLEIAGSYNIFLNCRFEATTANVLFTGHASSTLTFDNQIVGGYNAWKLTVTRSGKALYNQIISPRTISHQGSGVCLNLQNLSSGDYPLLQGFDPTTTGEVLGAGNSATEWTVRVSSSAILGKAEADTDERIKIATATGAVTWGGGSGATDVSLTRSAANALQLASGDSFKLAGGAWDTGTLQLGGYHLWVDSTGDLRIKSGAPTGDTDGTIVGTQS